MALDNYTIARERMVEEQLVQRGIKDPLILDAMRRVPRHLFVDESTRDQAYEDHPLPIGEGQTISQPYMIALMALAMQLAEGEHVLEVGTGSGYLTAILAEQGVEICSVELSPQLAQRSQAVLHRLGYQGVAVHVGDGTLGWPEAAPFDAIVIGAAAPGIPTSPACTTPTRRSYRRPDGRRRSSDTSTHLEGTVWLARRIFW